MKKDKNYSIQTIKNNLIISPKNIIAIATIVIISLTSNVAGAYAQSYQNTSNHNYSSSVLSKNASALYTYNGNKKSNSSTPVVVTVSPTSAYPTSTSVTTVVSTPAPVTAPTSTSVVASVTLPLQWGAYVGDAATAISSFESLVGAKTNIIATFDGWDTGFPTNLSSTVGQQGKTLVVFWEPSFGFNQITNGSEDSYIQQFAAGAKSYGYPVILVPFDEMNLNEQAWGYSMNGNSAASFQQAWKHIHDLFVGDSNVKFAIDYNNVSEPNVSGNQFSDYYPGSSYVDYVGIDGFNFGNPTQSVSQVFDTALSQTASFGKPIYILSTGSIQGTDKASWITSLGSYIKSHSNIQGWVWFNQNDATAGAGDSINWTVNSDNTSLAAFQSII